MNETISIAFLPLSLEDIEVTAVRDAVAIPETGASTGVSSCDSCSCCASTSCCSF